MPCKGEKNMTTIFADPQDKRIQKKASFAEGFTHFEWMYLCSYRWFLKSLARAAESGDFTKLQISAERALIEGHLRRPDGTSNDELTLCHACDWYE